MRHTRHFRDFKICLVDYLKVLQLALFSNLHTCISLVKVCRFAQCLGLRCSLIYIFFSLACFRAFTDAPHSRFWCGDPNQCLPNFLKMQLLALLQISTCISLVGVYRFGQCLGERFSPILTFFSLGSSGAFRDAPYSLLRCGDPNQCLPNFLKMLLLALP